MNAMSDLLREYTPGPSSRVAELLRGDGGRVLPTDEIEEWIDASCLCAMYDPRATRKPAAASDSQCDDDLTAAFGFYVVAANIDGMTASDFIRNTCEANLALIPPDRCGYPGDVDPFGLYGTQEPYLPPETAAGGHGRHAGACSFSPTPGRCAFDTYDAVSRCKWYDALECLWNHDEQTCTGNYYGASSESLGSASSSADCGSKNNQDDCRATVYHPGFCSYPRTTTGDDDPDNACLQDSTDAATCRVATFSGPRACAWYAKAFGRATTYQRCCDPPPYESPYAGTVWCAAIGLEYVREGRIWSGLAGTELMCDDVAGTYVRGVHGREVFLSNPETASLVGTVDEYCCRHPPTVAPTDDPTAMPSSTPSQVPTDDPIAMPSSTPSQVPTDDPIAMPSSTPSEVPTSAPVTLSKMPSFAATSKSPDLLPGDPVATTAPSAVPSVGATLALSAPPSSIPTDYAEDVPNRDFTNSLPVAALRSSVASGGEDGSSAFGDVAPAVLWGAVAGGVVILAGCVLHRYRATKRESTEDDDANA